jgi:hypothetical protein
MRRASLPAALLFTALVGSAGCAPRSPAEQADVAQAALSQGDFATARAAAQAALSSRAVAGDKALTWKLERIGLEAAAGEGKGADVLAGVDRLAADFPTQMTAELYAKLGNRLADGGDALGALDLVDAGKRRFPEQATAFDGLIESLKDKAEGDSAVMDKLRSLGYL